MKIVTYLMGWIVKTGVKWKKSTKIKPCYELSRDSSWHGLMFVDFLPIFKKYMSQNLFIYYYYYYICRFFLPYLRNTCLIVSMCLYIIIWSHVYVDDLPTILFNPEWLWYGFYAQRSMWCLHREIKGQKFNYMNNIYRHFSVHLAYIFVLHIFPTAIAAY